MNVPIKKSQKVKVKGSYEVYDIMQKILLRENRLRRKQEYFWAVGLNTANVIEYIELVALGKINVVNVRPVELFSFAVQKRCDKLILVHNHPSGQLMASDADKKFTKRIVAAANLMEIEIVDHLIITEKEYYSFLDNDKTGKLLK